jgi:hypothetical protein
MWGGGSPLLDLAVAYEKAAAVVLAARPTYLVIAQVRGRRARGPGDKGWVGGGLVQGDGVGGGGERWG